MLGTDAHVPSHRVPGFIPGYSAFIQLPLNISGPDFFNAHPGRQQAMAQVFESLPPVRETQMDCRSVSALIVTGIWEGNQLLKDLLLLK